MDQLLLKRELVESRSQARGMIMAGKVEVDGRIADKAGVMVPTQAKIQVRQDAIPFVSRGGLKLDGFLQEFTIEVNGVVAADIGASTGGFTDCLLQRGATRVYAVDVGYGQLHERLSADPRVVVLERMNARQLALEPFEEPLPLFVIDVSFISLKKIIPGLMPLSRGEPADLIALVKPQFEAGKREADRGEGVIRDPRIHRGVLEDLWDFLENTAWKPIAAAPSSIHGAAGNREFFLAATSSAAPRSASFHPDWTREDWMESAVRSD